MKKIGILISAALLFIQASPGHRMTRTEYFERYGDLAVREMYRSGVPASITLAQGALESGDGNSILAVQANNHFGIKCHEDWYGRKIYQDDDRKNECFRRYESVEDSYKDHSDYLRVKQRYAFLFELKVTDYKGWAKGLKKAGYATNPAYAESLIRIIEEFRLDRYDTETVLSKPSSHNRHPAKNAREGGEINRVKFLMARSGDTYALLTKELGKLDWELRQYNDANSADSLVPGQVVYIQPKRNKAQAGSNTHVVKAGETMLSISQKYAMKQDRLYYLNGLTVGSKPEPGTILQLRKASRTHAQVTVQPKEKIPEGEEEDEIKVDLNLD
jgi:LysM repeat protein